MITGKWSHGEASSATQMHWQVESWRGIQRHSDALASGVMARHPAPKRGPAKYPCSAAGLTRRLRSWIWGAFGKAGACRVLSNPPSTHSIGNTNITNIHGQNRAARKRMISCGGLCNARGLWAHPILSTEMYRWLVATPAGDRGTADGYDSTAPTKPWLHNSRRLQIAHLCSGEVRADTRILDSYRWANLPPIRLLKRHPASWPICISSLTLCHQTLTPMNRNTQGGGGSIKASWYSSRMVIGKGGGMAQGVAAGQRIRQPFSTLWGISKTKPVTQRRSAGHLWHLTSRTHGGNQQKLASNRSGNHTQPPTQPLGLS